MKGKKNIIIYWIRIKIIVNRCGCVCVMQKGLIFLNLFFFLSFFYILSHSLPVYLPMSLYPPLHLPGFLTNHLDTCQSVRLSLKKKIIKSLCLLLNGNSKYVVPLWRISIFFSSFSSSSSTIKSTIYFQDSFFIHFESSAWLFRFFWCREARRNTPKSTYILPGASTRRGGQE